MKKILSCMMVLGALGTGLAKAAEPTGHLQIFPGIAPISETELARYAGRGDVEPNLMGSALVESNQVGANTVTGANNIAGSLNGTGGFTTVFQNSGNNSLFQAVTTVNITIR